MYIVMHCGGIPFNGDTIKTVSLGGSETAAYYMARALVSAGHDVRIFTNSRDSGKFDGVNYEYAGEPTEQAPLGNRFMFYAENTPHDVCIIQRHPLAFARKLASKINLWWLHDIALIRNRDQVLSQMWNVDKVLCVSEYHKKQVSEAWGIPVDNIAVVRNAVDLSLFDRADHPPAGFEENKKKRNFFYSSRPERGLINLVQAGGIMEKLMDNPDIHLFVCGYDNTTPQMAELYQMLWERCDELPNVTNLGALTKSELAQLMLRCEGWLYPTEFEEVSCITAMEAMSAGCRIIASSHGAIPETCSESAAELIPLVDGHADIDAFVDAVSRTIPARHEAASRFTWERSAVEVLDTVRCIFADASAPADLAFHYMRHSDIAAFEHLNLSPNISCYADTLLYEYEIGYAFKRSGRYAEHYAAYYQYEADRGVNYGPEDVTGTSRFQQVANMISDLPDHSVVLDYGCAHGHYTVALAKMFSKLTFLGADLAASNVQKARAWAQSLALENVSFVQVNDVDDLADTSADFIIAAEVVEHVGDPQRYVDALGSMLRKGGRMVLTVPYGAWEAQGYRHHGFWRAHLHHFERADLAEMFGHHPNYRVLAAPSGTSQFSSVLGSYIVSFDKPVAPSREVNYLRKSLQTMPDQTVSCCMIVKDSESDILRCLKSVAPHVQEFVIGVDEKSSDSTERIIREFADANPLIAFNVFSIVSPVEQGFDAARNTTIEKASCNWILWIDADEVLIHGERMSKMTRNSMYNGFAIKQHHLSQDPVTTIKVDLPCRLFRNRKDIKFFGLVHEHPEQNINEGLGPVMLLNEAHIIHYGYADEKVRRARFYRNLPMLQRDRDTYPDRLLGKFLWLRDLAQICQYELEEGRPNCASFSQRAEDGIKLWEELLASKNLRLVVDALPFYSQLVAIRGNGVDFSFATDANVDGQSADAGREPAVSGYFASKEHAIALMTAIAEDKMRNYGAKYL